MHAEQLFLLLYAGTARKCFRFYAFYANFMQSEKTKSRRQLIAAADRFETLESVYRFIVSFVLRITLRFRPR